MEEADLQIQTVAEIPADENTAENVGDEEEKMNITENVLIATGTPEANPPAEEEKVE